jgi:hypothetical protein
MRGPRQGKIRRIRLDARLKHAGMTDRGKEIRLTQLTAGIGPVEIKTSTRGLAQCESDLSEDIFFCIRDPLAAESKNAAFVRCFGHSMAHGQ